MAHTIKSYKSLKKNKVHYCECIVEFCYFHLPCDRPGVIHFTYCTHALLFITQLIHCIDSQWFHWVHRMMDVLLCELSGELEMSILIVAECYYSAKKALPFSYPNGVLSTSLYWMIMQSNGEKSRRAEVWQTAVCRQQSSRQFTLVLMVYWQFGVLGVSISRHQFLIWCFYAQFAHITNYSNGTLTKYAPGPDPLLDTGLSCQECLSSYISIRNMGVCKCRRWSVVRGNRLDVFWGPVGDCRDLWEDDLISNFFLSCLGCRLVAATNTEALEMRMAIWSDPHLSGICPRCLRKTGSIWTNKIQILFVIFDGRRCGWNFDSIDQVSGEPPRLIYAKYSLVRRLQPDMYLQHCSFIIVPDGTQTQLRTRCACSEETFPVLSISSFKDSLTTWNKVTQLLLVLSSIHLALFHGYEGKPWRCK